MGRWWQPTVVGPVLAAGLVFAVADRVPPAAMAPPSPRAIELPPLAGLPAAKATRRYDLRGAASSVRFRVAGHGQPLWVECAAPSGTLELGGDPPTGTLELRLDLAKLQPRSGSGREDELRQLLGVHRGTAVTWRGKLVATTTTALPGVTQQLWLGTLRFADQVRQQPMELWQCALPGQPLRLQGHGTVSTAAYHLPRRSRLGLLPASHAVTVGLDLAWQRHTDR